MNNIRGKLPSIGSLVTLKPYNVKMSFIKVEKLSIDGHDDDTRDFPAGTLAMVIGHADHPDDTSGEIKVPLIVVEGFQGWIFNDEWKRINPARQKHAT